MMCNITETLFAQSAVSTVLVDNSQGPCNAWSFQYPFVWFFICLVIRTCKNKQDFTKLTTQEQKIKCPEYVAGAGFSLVLGLFLYSLTISCSHPIAWLVFVASSL